MLHRALVEGVCAFSSSVRACARHDKDWASIMRIGAAA